MHIFTTLDDVIQHVKGAGTGNPRGLERFFFGSRLYLEGAMPIEAMAGNVPIVSAAWVSCICRFKPEDGLETEDEVSGGVQNALIPIHRYEDETAEEAISMFPLRLTLAVNRIWHRNTYPMLYISGLQTEMMPSEALIQHYNFWINNDVQLVHIGQGTAMTHDAIGRSDSMVWVNADGSPTFPMLLQDMFNRREEEDNDE